MEIQSHLYGTRWIHLWLQIRSLIKEPLDIRFLTSSAKTHNMNHKPDVSHELFYHTSHSLKAPVCRLKGLLQLLSTGEEIIDSKQYMLKIGEEVAQMENLLGKVQVLNEISNDGVVKTSFKLSTVVEHVLRRHQVRIQKRNVLVRVSTDAEIVVNTDEKLLFYVLDNLVENAIGYSKLDFDHQSYVDIGLETTGRHLEVSVQDNGEGIRPEAIDKVFDMFYRDSVMSEGGGLGLYLAKEATKKLNGYLELQSEKNVYTKVTLRLPSVCHSNQKKHSMLI